MSVTLKSAASVPTERVRWLIRSLVPLRGVTVVGGEAKLGKSLLTGAVWPAAVTRGATDGEHAGEPRSVLILSAEDDWPTVISPRLMAAGADLERVHFLDGADAFVELPRDVGTIEEAVTAIGDCSLVVVDPVGAFLAGDIDSHRDASVRHALAPLADMAMRTGVAVAVVCHLNKAEGSRLVHRVVGSVAFVAAARSFVAFGRDPEDPEGERGSRRVIVPTSCNWGPLSKALAANVEGRVVELHDGSRESVGYLDITGESQVAVEDLQRAADQSSADDVEAAIVDVLAGGAEHKPRDVKRAVCAEVGCVTRTVERAADRLESKGMLARLHPDEPSLTRWRACDTLLTVAVSHDAEGPETLGFSSLRHGDSQDHVASGVDELDAP